MPDLNTVERFLSLVEAGQRALALEQFYAEHASTQKNGVFIGAAK